MMGRRGAESTLRRGFLAGTGSGTAALRRPFHPVYSLLYYYAFKHRPSSRVYYSSGRASGCPIQFISGGGNTEASLYLMFWSPPIHPVQYSMYCTVQYFVPPYSTTTIQYRKLYSSHAAPSTVYQIGLGPPKGYTIEGGPGGASPRHHLLRYVSLTVVNLTDTS